MDNSESLKMEFEIKMMSRMQNIIPLRAEFCTQKEAAHKFGCSLRKIQMFENYISLDPFLIWCYSRSFK